MHVHGHAVRLARRPQRLVALVVERRCVVVVEQDRDGHAREARGGGVLDLGDREVDVVDRQLRDPGAALAEPARRSRRASGCTRAARRCAGRAGTTRRRARRRRGRRSGTRPRATTPSSSSSCTRRSESHWPDGAARDAPRSRRATSYSSSASRENSRPPSSDALRARVGPLAPRPQRLLVGVEVLARRGTGGSARAGRPRGSRPRSRRTGPWSPLASCDRKRTADRGVVSGGGLASGR